jgi:hypothetical protein
MCPYYKLLKKLGKIAEHEKHRDKALDPNFEGEHKRG